jgi:Fe2+ transport system protein FeoA
MPPVLELLMRPFRRSRPAGIAPSPAETEPLSLSSFRVNTRATVVSLNAPDRFRLKKILAMGITPGVEIILLRKFPSFVFQIGHSCFSVDRELAGSILVDPTA